MKNLIYIFISGFLFFISFSISAQNTELQLLSPNGGEVYYRLGTVHFYWTYTGAEDTLKITLIKRDGTVLNHDGKEYAHVVSAKSGFAAIDEFFPASMAADFFKVKISTRNNTKSDMSDDFIQLAGICGVTLLPHTDNSTCFFAELTLDQPSPYASYTDGRMLRFRYLEKYFDRSSSDNVITTIYDQAMNVIYTITLSDIKLGYNYYVLDIAKNCGSFRNNAYYLLEVNDPKSGQKSYLRFQYRDSNVNNLSIYTYDFVAQIKEEASANIASYSCASGGVNRTYSFLVKVSEKNLSSNFKISNATWRVIQTNQTFNALQHAVLVRSVGNQWVSEYWFAFDYRYISANNLYSGDIDLELTITDACGYSEKGILKVSCTAIGDGMVTFTNGVHIRNLK